MYQLFDQQPDPILAETFKNLTATTERVRLREVSKRFKQIIDNQALMFSKDEIRQLPEAMVEALCGNAIDFNKETTNVFANEREQFAFFKKLIAMGTNPNMTIDQDRSNRWLLSPAKLSILAVAAWIGNLKLVDLLLRKGVDVNYQGQFELSALHLAAREGHARICKLLIEHGANRHLTTNHFDNTLFTAASFALDSWHKSFSHGKSYTALAQALETNENWELAFAEEDQHKGMIKIDRFNLRKPNELLVIRGSEWSYPKKSHTQLR